MMRKIEFACRSRGIANASRAPITAQAIISRLDAMTGTAVGSQSSVANAVASCVTLGAFRATTATAKPSPQ